jgi:hypothetical protein
VFFGLTQNDQSLINPFEKVQEKMENTKDIGYDGMRWREE